MPEPKIKAKPWHIDPVVWMTRTASSANNDDARPWQSGCTSPLDPGWYERAFIDGVFKHWWSGEHWSSIEGGLPHWRQVGDYPCWRVTHATGMPQASDNEWCIAGQVAALSPRTGKVVLKSRVALDLQEELKRLRDALHAIKANAGKPQDVYRIAKEALGV